MRSNRAWARLAESLRVHRAQAVMAFVKDIVLGMIRSMLLDGISMRIAWSSSWFSLLSSSTFLFLILILLFS